MRRLTPCRGFIALAAVLCFGACEAAKSANPTAPSVAGPIPGVSITAPRALEPGAGSTLTFGAEPPTLLIENPGSSGVRTFWLQLEVGTDAGFQQVVHQADRVTPGDGGRTSYRLPEPLGAGFTYYWRSRAADGANTGPYSAVSSFNVVPPVVINPPTPSQPSGAISTNRPEFRAANGAISGTTGVIYRFEISTAADMSNLTAVVTAVPGSNGTTTMTLGDLPYSTTFYWRAYATDGTIQSSHSSTLSFRTPAPPPPPAPTPAPSPSPGAPPSASGPVGGPRTISAHDAMLIIKGVHDAEGWNLGGSSSREQRIAFLMRAAAVVHYGHSRFNRGGPDSNWCVKDAGGGRPISDDVIVRCNTRESYDLIVGAGGNGYNWHVDAIGVLPAVQNVFPPPRSALP
jgi:hypothetical protein